MDTCQPNMTSLKLYKQEDDIECASNFVASVWNMPNELKRREMIRHGKKFEGEIILAQRFVFVQSFNPLVISITEGSR